jgi:hypothetical protein
MTEQQIVDGDGAQALRPAVAEARPAHNADLENLATSVELTLASVLQGLALSLLIPKAVDLVTSGELAKLPYIPASLLLIFLVWVAFIGHALSFITWPFDPLHNFLYFLITGSEAVLLAFIDQPGRWFLGLVGFALVMGFNVWYNRRLLGRQLHRYTSSAAQALYSHILAEQRTNLRFMIGYLLLGAVGFIALQMRPEFGLPQETGWAVTGFGAMLLPLVHVVRQAGAMSERARLIERTKAEEQVL